MTTTDTDTLAAVREKIPLGSADDLCGCLGYLGALRGLVPEGERRAVVRLAAVRLERLTREELGGVEEED